MSWAELAATPLENERVLLSPLREQDRSPLLELALDPRIWRYFVLRIDTAADFHRWFDGCLAQQEAGTRIVFCITDKSRGTVADGVGTVAGTMSYSTLLEKERRVEIGASWLGIGFQGTGVNRAAKLALLSHAFETLGAERVEFKTDVLNTQARRALTDIGAVEEGVLRSFNFMPDGRRRDAIYYSILRAEWPAVRDALAERVRAARTSTVQTADRAGAVDLKPAG